MIDNPYQSPPSETAQAPSSAQAKRPPLPYLWNFGILAAAAWYTWEMTWVIVQLYGLLHKLNPTGGLYVHDVAIMVDVAAHILWVWFLAGSLGSWTWTKVGRQFRWLYAAGFLVFLVGSIVRLAIDRFNDLGFQSGGNGLDGYLLFVGLFALVAFPIVVYGTGYLGLIAHRFQRRVEVR